MNALLIGLIAFVIFAAFGVLCWIATLPVDDAAPKPFEDIFS